MAPLHPFGINFSWISPYLGAGCSIVAGESAEMSSGCDLGDPVGGLHRSPLLFGPSNGCSGVGDGKKGALFLVQGLWRLVVESV